MKFQMEESQIWMFIFMQFSTLMLLTEEGLEELSTQGTRR
jgi:hypothetical protein